MLSAFISIVVSIADSLKMSTDTTPIKRLKRELASTPKKSCDMDLESPSPSPIDQKAVPLDRMDKCVDALKSDYAQYVLGARSLIEMNPPFTKAASAMMAKGEQAISNRIGEIQWQMNSLKLIIDSKDQTISFLRKEVANLSQEVANLSFPSATLDDDNEDLFEKTSENTITDTDPMNIHVQTTHTVEQSTDAQTKDKIQKSTDAQSP